MRSICSITTRPKGVCKSLFRAAAFLTAVMTLLAGPCAALASVLDNMFTVGIISVKTSRLNPFFIEEREFKSIACLIYESLVTIDDDYMPQPSVAERWDSADGSSWTFTIRSGITFHDGTPMTAYDVYATIQEILRLADEGKGQYATLKYMIKSVTIKDERTITITTSRKYYGFLYAMTFPILKQDQVQEDNPIGSGPYYIQAFSPGDYVYLTAYTNWWKSTPSITQINVVLFSSNKDLINAYEYNRIDAAVTRSSNAAQYSRTAKSLSITYRTQQLETLLINRSSFPVNDPEVRMAIRYAVNPDVLLSSAYQGMAARTDTPLPQGTWMYNTRIASYPYDPDKAKQLLSDAGWVASSDDNMLHKVVDGKTRNLHIRLYVYEEQDNSVRVSAAHLIASQLEAVGFGVTVTNMSFSQTKEKLAAGNFDLCLAAFQMDPVPDPGFMLMSSNTGNYSRYSSTQMNNLFSSLRNSGTSSDDRQKFEAYKENLHAIQEQFYIDVPFICLYYRTGAIMTRKMFTVARDVREPDLFRGIESFSQ